MEQTTLVNGTAYSIYGGLTLIDGTGYLVPPRSYPLGLTMVNGAVYEMWPYIVVTIDNVEYRAKAGVPWADWVNSAYSIGGFMIYNGMVLKARMQYEAIAVVPNDGNGWGPNGILMESQLICEDIRLAPYTTECHTETFPNEAIGL